MSFVDDQDPITRVEIVCLVVVGVVSFLTAYIVFSIVLN